MPSNSQQAHYSLQQASRRAGFHHSDRKNERNKNTVKFLPKKRKEKSTRDFHSWSPFSKDPPFHFFHSVYLTQRKCVSLWLCGKLRGGYPCTGMLCRERQPHSSQAPCVQRGRVGSVSSLIVAQLFDSMNIREKYIHSMQ